MNNKQIKSEIARLLALGASKSDIFEQLCAQGAKERVVAALLAGRADPVLVEQHQGKIIGLLVMMAIQGGLAALLGLSLGVSTGGMGLGLGLAALGIAVSALFAWGFKRNWIGAYRGFVILSVSQLPKAFRGFESDPVACMVGVGISIAMIAYVLFVQTRIFPDMVGFAPRRVGGKYVFQR